MNKPIASLTHEDISDLIDELAGNCTSEELHGLIAGQIAAGEKHSDDAWQKVLLEFIDPEETPSTVVKREMAELTKITQEEMLDPDLGFQLMLPMDTESLQTRTQALGRWVQGFLAGFGLAGNSTREEAGEEVEEILRDLVSISQVESDSEETEENEENFFVLVEYVRMAILNIYMECGGHEPKSSPEPQLH